MDQKQNFSYIQWLRGLVGRRKIILIFSSIVLRDARERVLLQCRMDFDVWGLPGGILEPGENILQCAHRELFEETGLSAGPLSLVGVYTDPKYDSLYPNGDQVQQYTVCFQGSLAGGAMQVDGVETKALAFFEPVDIPMNDLPDFYQAMIQDALSGRAPHFLPPTARPELVNPVEDLRPIIGQALYLGAGAMAVTVNQDGCLLVVKRADDGIWTLPGGYMHLGENVAHAAVREVLEETGIHITVDRLLGIYSPTIPWVYPNGDQAQAVITLFRAHPIGGELRPDMVETSQVAWISPAELLKIEKDPTMTELHQAIVTHLEEGVFVI